MQKPRILIIENSIDVTGALKSITRTAVDCRSYYDFQFIIPKNSKGRFWIEGNRFSNIHELPMTEISKKFSSILLYLPCLLINTVRLFRLVRKERIDIIHGNDLYNLLPVMLGFVGSRIPYICHVRFLPSHFPSLIFNFWLKLHLRFANKVICVSERVLHELPYHPKLVLIYNELPVDERYPEPATYELAPHPTFLYLSNFMDGKGQKYAIDAFFKVQHQLPNWKLRFVGGDMGLTKNQIYRENLKKHAETLGISKKIEWLAFTEDVEKEYKQAEIVLNFSESESFSITCLEALFFGRPLIATDCGGPSEIIDNKISGILVPNKDVEAMSKAMIELAFDTQLRSRLGRRARVLVREKFSFEKTSLRLKKLYDELCS